MMGLILFFHFLIQAQSQAEYRAYKLLIQNTKTQQKREITSFLDHNQYVGYYPLNANETIEYVDSWMCWERTNLQAICPNPKLTPGPTTQTIEAPAINAPD